MATFTRIADDERPTISVDPSAVLSTIDDNIYGGFTEHMGRCIYGGIYDPGNPLSDENGFRKDVIEAMKELNCPVVRYPGGNFVATYHWQDGIGPREKRPARPELAWIGTESNEFGTDEFLKWCEVVGTEPYLCLNFGTGTLDEALGWVEYCNSDRPSYYANLRRQNGREKPYNVNSLALLLISLTDILRTGQVLGSRKRNVGTMASRPNDKGRLRKESIPMGKGHQAPRSQRHTHPLR
jgi:alpha-N-arabinofuranosidase